MFSARKFICFLPWFCCSFGLADSVIYELDDHGQVVSKTVLESAITEPDAGPSGEVNGSKPKSKRSTQPEKKKSSAASVSTRQTHHDIFAQFRCERHGFYYTKQGNCVVPAWPVRHDTKKGK